MPTIDELPPLDPLEELHKAQAKKLGLTMEEYTELGKTVRPEDTVDEAIIPTNLRQLNS